ncbi:hypothetical protein AB0D46_06225 [Streptomyces sp. NPDC048383]|uniref:hypothetical protein n=1 Tax=Streptomyces sp. NPDC048383 TaxID=3155386 RepID=UPI0034200822
MATRAMTVACGKRVDEAPRTIRVPGSDVAFRCTTVNEQTVCGWGDDNTPVAIAFSPAADSHEPAAAEAHRIRDAIRRPVVP